MSDILDRLKQLKNDDMVPMHMPGAKRNIDICSMQNPYGIDITEIDGFDNFHNPTGIIKYGFERAAKLFGAKESLFLINGSSAGILSAICGATNRGDKIIVARNVHCSVVHAIYINQLRPLYVYPKIIDAYCGIYGAVNPDDIQKLFISNKEVSAVVITSPTYEGMISDIKKISDIVHKYGAILIVDEAHGAHFHFHQEFPASAVCCGADLVIQSIHKTLPALTQTALLHICSDNVNIEKVKMYWNIYQTTSPSYILMASIDQCITIIEQNGSQLYAQYIYRLLNLRSEIKKLHYIKLIDTDDISKIVLCIKNGKVFYNVIKDIYNIQLEMASLHYVIAMTSVCDTDEYYDRFLYALRNLDTKEVEMSNDLKDISNSDIVEAKTCTTIYDALNKAFCGECELVQLKNSIGRVACKNVCFYPPGINLINSGELITENIVKKIADGIINGLEVIGLEIDENFNNKLLKHKAEYENEIYKINIKNIINIDNDINKKEERSIKEINLEIYNEVHILCLK